MDKNKLLVIGFSILIFFIALFLFIKITGPIPFAVNNTNTLNNTPFEARGTGKASAAPDTAVINLGITQEGATVLEAQSNTNEVAQAIVNGLKKQGIEEKNIKTVNYSVNPNYSFERGDSQRITGYTVTQNFEVKSPIDKANSVIDTATANGANLVGNISFTLEDEKLEELRNEARKEAIEKAKSSAEGLASAAGIKLGKIINVNESFNDAQPFPIARDMMALASPEEDAPPTQITPGETNVEVNVVLTYQTL
jgi:uncharacterized protein